MALSLSSRTRVASSSRRYGSHRTRAPTVVVKAVSLKEASDWFAQAFVRIFSPDDTKLPTTNFPTTPFTGRIDRSKRPFKDGFNSNASLPPSSSMESTIEPTLEPTNAEDAASYVEGAVKGAVSGFPKVGQQDERNWTGAASGWSGEVHKSDNKRDTREGFHTKKY